MTSTSYPDLFAALAQPFEPGEVKARNQSGRVFHYVTARTVMNRLDNVLGPEKWWDEYRTLSDSSVACRLTIRLPDGSTLTKEDAGGSAGMADAGDDDKSTFSDAFKRAAVKFGVARYLYGDGVPAFVRSAPAPTPAPAPEPATLGWVHGDVSQARGPSAPEPAAAPDRNGHAGTPRSGRALFAWLKNQEQQYGLPLLKYINNWGKLQEFPGRIVDWDDDQVRMAAAEAGRKLAAVVNAARRVEPGSDG